MERSAAPWLNPMRIAIKATRTRTAKKKMAMSSACGNRDGIISTSGPPFSILEQEFEICAQPCFGQPLIAPPARQDEPRGIARALPFEHQLRQGSRLDHRVLAETDTRARQPAAGNETV